MAEETSTQTLFDAVHQLRSLVGQAGRISDRVDLLVAKSGVSGSSSPSRAGLTPNASMASMVSDLHDTISMLRSRVDRIDNSISEINLIVGGEKAAGSVTFGSGLGCSR